MYAEDVIVEDEAVIGRVNVFDINKGLGGSLKEILNRNLQVSKLLEAKESEIRENIQNIHIEDLEVVKKLGNGQFGSVYLVK